MSRIIITTIIIIAVVLIVFGYNSGIADPKPTLKMVVTTGYDENDSVKVTNVTFEQTEVPFFYKKVDTPPKFPEINVFGRIDNMSSTPSTFWSAVYRSEDEGVYVLTIIFKDGQEPKNGSLLILPIKLTDFRGNQIYKTTAFYEWKE